WGLVGDIHVANGPERAPPPQSLQIPSTGQQQPKPGTQAQPRPDEKGKVEIGEMKKDQTSASASAFAFALPPPTLRRGSDRSVKNEAPCAALVGMGVSGPWMARGGESDRMSARAATTIPARVVPAP
ncbi:hypothetical protein, partial [Stenotrophomonas panacihumi]|uniref:hypothetical protein n=1 Tax=Stenotrophomonas panacihumi TaxID=676599 RepID=UPI001C6322BF